MGESTSSTRFRVEVSAVPERKGPSLRSHAAICRVLQRSSDLFRISGVERELRGGFHRSIYVSFYKIYLKFYN
jgi:hypothetical protein